MSVCNPLHAQAACVALLLLSACSGPEGQFPSLERRPYETDAPVAAPAPPPAAPAALPDTLASKVKSIINRHETANASFTKGLPSVRGTAAKAAGTAPGSESWVNAHLQLSRLDKSRADSVAALGELDTLIADQIEGDSAYVELLVEYQQDIATDVAKQRDEIDRMSRQIGE